MDRPVGAVACGHPAVADVAERVLIEGGNAFDAIVAAQFSACVAEPVLASLGGGGYLLACPASGTERLYDFFVQTPRQKRPSRFYPVLADFGDVTQEFHIGPGSTATPGMVKGAFSIHADLCSMPMSALMQPAIEQASLGVEVTPMQAYVFDVVSPIYRATPSAREAFLDRSGQLPAAGDLFRRKALSDTLDGLAREGEALFYRGDLAKRIIAMYEADGHLGPEDLRNYEVIRREPLAFAWEGSHVLTNPTPSVGGVLIAHALKWLEGRDLGDFGGDNHLRLLAGAMARSGRMRGSDGLAEWAGNPAPEFTRGTTHISVADREGNLASMSLTNGEGCGEMVPGAGFMMNNMLGEEDINPAGPEKWPVNRRMASMMSPAVVSKDGRRFVLGSGGSSRIRSAILQVIVNLVHFRLDLEAAIHHPRIHLENDCLNVEPGFSREGIRALDNLAGTIVTWPDRNLFFGGVHTVEQTGRGFRAFGDPRRGGVGRQIS